MRDVYWNFKVSALRMVPFKSPLSPWFCTTDDRCLVLMHDLHVYTTYTRVKICYLHRCPTLQSDYCHLIRKESRSRFNITLLKWDGLRTLKIPQKGQEGQWRIMSVNKGMRVRRWRTGRERRRAWIKGQSLWQQLEIESSYHYSYWCINEYLNSLDYFWKTCCRELFHTIICSCFWSGRHDTTAYSAASIKYACS